MRYGILSGILWGVDTVVLGIALAMAPFATAPQASFASAFLHDFACAVVLLVYMGARGRLKDTLAALKTASGRAVMLGALVGGPIGMTGYLIAIDNIGAGYTAAISAFYPAFGTLLAVLVLHEKISAKQVVALLAALAGVMVMGWSSAGASTTGNAFMGIAGALVCVLGWGSEAVILAWGMKDDAVDNETALQIRETTSALAYGLILVPLTGSLGLVGQAFFTPANAVVFAAGIAGSISYLFYYKAIDTIGAARGMALNISYSAWAVILGALAGAVPGPLEIACCAVIIVGTVLSATPNWRELGLKRA